jgi:hypothetical protein
LPQIRLLLRLRLALIILIILSFDRNFLNLAKVI